MRRRPGHSLPELLITSVVVLLLLSVVAIVLSLAMRSRDRVDARVDLQLAAQEWLNRMADDLSAGARRRLFQDRCEIDVFQQAELLRFRAAPPFRYDAARGEALLDLGAPLGQPEPGWESSLAAVDFDRGQVLGVAPSGPSQLRLTFPEPPAEGDRVLVEYPVNHLLVYWREPATGVLRREWRDSAGATRLEVLNPPDRAPWVACERLAFTQVGVAVVRIELGVRGAGGATWRETLDISTAR